MNKNKKIFSFAEISKNKALDFFSYFQIEWKAKIQKNNFKNLNEKVKSIEELFLKCLEVFYLDQNFKIEEEILFFEFIKKNFDNYLIFEEKLNKKIELLSLI